MLALGGSSPALPPILLPVAADHDPVVFRLERFAPLRHSAAPQGRGLPDPAASPDSIPSGMESGLPSQRSGGK